MAAVLQLPSTRSAVSLVILAAGCACYVLSDKQFMVEVGILQSFVICI